MNRTLRHVAAIGLALAGCGSPSEPPPPPPPTNPIPVIAAVSPDTIVAETAGATLSIRGTGFVSTSLVRLDDRGRPTTFVSGTELRATLSTADVQEGRSGFIRVLNPAPGGGLTPSYQIAIAYERPSLDSIPPVEIDPFLGPGIRLTGHGFSRRTALFLDGRPVSEMSQVSPTELAVTLPDSVIHRIRTLAATATNPTPGGGTSPVRQLAVAYLAPRLDSVTPGMLWAGRPAQLRVHGLRFRPNSIAWWRGRPHPLTLVTYSAALVDLGADEITSAGTVDLTVETPGPAGGTSAPRPVIVHPEPPKILSVTPSSVNPSAGSLTVTIHGTNLLPPQRTLVGGAERVHRTIDSTRIEVDLEPGDLLQPGPQFIQIHYPVFTDPPNPDAAFVAITVLPNGDPVKAVGVLGLETRDIVFDSTRGLVYATVPSNVTSFGNQVVAIDPASLAIVWHLPAGAGPSNLALSDNAAFLFVAFTGEPGLKRIALASRTIDLAIPLGQTVTGAAYGGQMVTLPGVPETVVVSLLNASSSPSDRIVIVDQSTVRSIPTAGWSALTRGGPTHVYGANLGFPLQIVRIGLGGAVPIVDTTDFIPAQSIGQIAPLGNLLATGRYVVDPSSASVVADLGFAGPVCADPTAGRIHLLSPDGVATFETAGFTRIFDTPLTTYAARRILRWGPDGLIFGSNGLMVSARLTAVDP
ncbi:MAG: IPT/TIG domain-containing protein [Gemmatimonadales bacterium]